jgi:alkylation response protein AidB-like acyl-CoA dehydrogenase
MRMVARRDLTVAIAHGKTFLGSFAVWLAGSPEQQTALQALIRSGKAISLALTEEAHGSDLVATELLATIDANGDYVLSGEKWLINNATRGMALSLITRIVGGRYNGSVAMFFVEKDKLEQGSCKQLPKNFTHGIRGADISGIAFLNSKIAGNALIGRPNDGLAIVLKLLQATRTGCTSLVCLTVAPSSTWP